MTDVMPFGKYKGEPVESVLETDPEYCTWAVAQSWFREKHPAVYNIFITRGGPVLDTPEHNEMQARFLNDDWCFWLARCLDVNAGGLVVHDRAFEAGGWDIVYEIGESDGWRRAGVYVECKPTLGDDYPHVLRQVKRYDVWPRHPSYRRCVLVRRASFEAVTWEQVFDIFASAEIALIYESDVTPLLLPSPYTSDDPDDDHALEIPDVYSPYTDDDDDPF